MLFSQRKGLKSVKSVMQFDEMDDELRNSLWNLISERLLRLRQYGGYSSPNVFFESCVEIWSNYFKLPIDTIPDDGGRVYNYLREKYFKSEWFEVYDFVEFLINSFSHLSFGPQFIAECNQVLEREMSGYRIIEGVITQITSDSEISSIQDALKTPLSSVRIHLSTALQKLSDRKNPDYRNSIKESISSVEALCISIVEDPKATLGHALKIIEQSDKIQLHAALKSSFSSLYGYTSDSDGIRHALLDEPNLSFEDAKFMLVTCSGFVNYLIEKCSKAGIKF